MHKFNNRPVQNRQAFRHDAIFAVQRHKANGKAALMPGNLRIKLRRQMEAQAQKIGIISVVLEETIQAGLLAERR